MSNRTIPVTELQAVESQIATVNPNPYLQETFDEETGEVMPVVNYDLEGFPKEYRFNGQGGEFNIFGSRPIMDASGKKAKSIKIHPIAYRVFHENLFNRGHIDWCEVFFIDESKTVSCIMFNGTSLNAALKLIQELSSERLSLLDVVLTIGMEPVTGPKGSWFKAVFEWDKADKQEVLWLREYEQSKRIYQKETVKDTSSYKMAKGSFMLELLRRSLENKAEDAQQETEN